MFVGVPSFGRLSMWSVAFCTGCGLCRKSCPAGAIGPDFQVDADRCISCFRCIRICPTGAKNMDTEEYRAFARMFTQKLAARRENEYFL